MRGGNASTDIPETDLQYELMDLFPFTESSDEDEASGDEGLPDDDSDVSYEKLACQTDPTSVCSKNLAELTFQELTNQ